MGHSNAICEVLMKNSCTIVLILSISFKVFDIIIIELSSSTYDRKVTFWYAKLFWIAEYSSRPLRSSRISDVSELVFVRIRECVFIQIYIMLLIRIVF